MLQPPWRGSAVSFAGFLAMSVLLHAVAIVALSRVPAESLCDRPTHTPRFTVVHWLGDRAPRLEPQIRLPRSRLNPEVIQGAAGGAFAADVQRQMARIASLRAEFFRPVSLTLLPMPVVGRIPVDAPPRWGLSLGTGIEALPAPQGAARGLAGARRDVCRSTGRSIPANVSAAVAESKLGEGLGSGVSLGASLGQMDSAAGGEDTVVAGGCDTEIAKASAGSAGGSEEIAPYGAAGGLLGAPSPEFLHVAEEALGGSEEKGEARSDAVCVMRRDPADSAGGTTTLPSREGEKGVPLAPGALSDGLLNGSPECRATPLSATTGLPGQCEPGATRERTSEGGRLTGCNPRAARSLSDGDCRGLTRRLRVLVGCPAAKGRDNDGLEALWKEVEARAALHVTATVGTLTGTDPKEISLLLLCGPETQALSAEEGGALAAYARGGGTVWVDSPAGSDTDAVRVFLQRTFGSPAVPLLPAHRVYRDWIQRESGHGSELPPLWAVFLNSRPAVFVSAFDVIGFEQAKTRAKREDVIALAASILASIAESGKP